MPSNPPARELVEDFTEPLTEFERASMQLGARQRLVLSRVETYDPQNGFFYSGCQHQAEPAAVGLPRSIDEQELWQRFEAFVRTEAPREEADRRARPCPKHLDWKPSDVLATSFIDEFAMQTETNTAFSQELDDIASNPDTGVITQILAVLSSSLLGDRRNKLLDLEEFETRLAHTVDERLPIRLVLPAFPFKDQNPFRTCSPASQPDMGDIALLVHLHAIALSVAQIYSYGCQWIILSDGTLYADIFDVDADEARRYVNCLRSWRNRLNLQQTIHILDLLDCARRSGLEAPRGSETARVPFRAAVDLAKALEDAAARDDAVREHAYALARGMARNMNTRSEASAGRQDAVWKGLEAIRLDFATARSARRGSVTRRLAERALTVAFAYAATNLTLQLGDALTTMFPHTLRATVHAKPGQVAVPRRGSVYPWNGVALLDDTKEAPRCIRSVPLHDVDAGGAVAALTLPDLESPFLFVKQR